MINGIITFSIYMIIIKNGGYFFLKWINLMTNICYWSNYMKTVFIPIFLLTN